jgi:hypothetical protein
MTRVLRVVAAIVVLTACGRKSAPVAPELVRPKAPGALSAASISDGIRLVWQRPVSYTSGHHMSDLGQFLIERSTSADGEFTRVDVLELDDRQRFRKERRLEWVDHDVTVGQLYRYRVTSETIDGYRSKPAGPVSILHHVPEPEPEKKKAPEDKKEKTK